MHVRPMELDDNKAVALLCTQLGYPVQPPTLRARLERLHTQPHHGLFVATDDAHIIGWVHVYRVELLESEGYTEVGGLVVDANARQQGVGRALMHAAEAWTRAQNMGRQRLYAGQHRQTAHHFYQKLGYLEHNPKMFQKQINAHENVNNDHAVNNDSHVSSK